MEKGWYKRRTCDFGGLEGQADMAVIKLEIKRRLDYHGGETFGEAGAYEQIDGIVHYAVDPEHERNDSIVDLELCPGDEQGLVHFSGDLTLLVPKDPARSSRRLFLELPNRGRKLVPRYVHRSKVEPGSSAEIPPGDGFLLRHGYIVAWVGWQWDV
jgi:hypothetical protein